MTRITWGKLLDEVSPAFDQITGSLEFKHGVLVEKPGLWISVDEFVSPYLTANLAEVSAIYFELTHRDAFKALSEECLRSLERSAVRLHGVLSWSVPFPWSGMDGWLWGQSYLAARILRDDAYMTFLGDVVRSWPWSERRQMFAQQVGSWDGREIASNHAYNLQVAAAAPAWMIGEALKDEVLLERGRGCVENFFLKGQLEAGNWPYDVERTCRTEPEDFYTLVTIWQASRLLQFDYWAKNEPFTGALRKGMEYVRSHCMREDGALVCKTHWGPGYIWGAEGRAAYVYWMLHRYLGDKAAAEYALKAVNWLLVCKPPGGYPFIGVTYGVGAHMDEVLRHLCHLAHQRFDAQGSVPGRGEHIASLREIAEQPSVVQPYGSMKTVCQAIIDRLRQGAKAQG